MALKIVQFLAVILTALALVPVVAHFFELPNKIALPRNEYFIVQAIYRGWALFGAVLVLAIAANLVLTLMLRPRRDGFCFAFCAFVLTALTLAIFFAWTNPANQATANWTTIPADWLALRRQWEYSHAANAVLTFLALCSVTLSLLSTRPRRQEPP
jgi:hypothetical protein